MLIITVKHMAIWPYDLHCRKSMKSMLPYGNMINLNKNYSKLCSRFGSGLINKSGFSNPPFDKILKD